MVSLKPHNPHPYKQVVHLYPDGEIRYTRSLCHLEKANDTDVTSLVVPTAQKKERNLSNKEKSKNIKPGWGKLSKQKKFTRYAKNTIRRIGGAMQLELGKERLAVLTLTVPGSANKIIEIIAAYSGYIMNRIETWLTDNFTHVDGKKYVVGVVELQKRGMLHWHFLVGLEDKLLIDSFRKKVEEFWFRLLKRLSKISEVDLFKRKQGDSWVDRWEKIKDRAVDVQPVKKNVAAYLAKYMSKGCDRAKSKGQNMYYSPSRWWSKSDDAMAVMHKWTESWQLPNVDEKFARDEMMLAIKDFLGHDEMWVVEITDPYRKEVCGIIGRGDYERCKQWCDDLVPVLKGMCEVHKKINVEYRKDYHQYVTELRKRKQEIIWDRKELKAEEIKQRKQYFRLIDEFRMSPDDAYKAVFGNKIAVSIDEICYAHRMAFEPKSRMIYDSITQSLIEVSEEEYRRLVADSS